MQSWGEFTQKTRSRLPDEWVVVTKANELKNGSINYSVPEFEFSGSLSDDDAPNWVGDNDLEAILNEPNTINATIIEFDFTTIANQVSFRYIFASEEYQEGNSNTCNYSDLFGFLIKPLL